MTTLVWQACCDGSSQGLSTTLLCLCLRKELRELSLVGFSYINRLGCNSVLLQCHIERYINRTSPSSNFTLQGIFRSKEGHLDDVKYRLVAR